MGTCHLAGALSLVYEQSILVLLFLCLYLLCFQFSSGPITWIYAAEVGTDQALGLSTLAFFATMLLIAMSMDFIIQSSLGPEGMFAIFSLVTYLGAIFVHVCVKETKGLTDIEKKTLFSKGDKS